MVRFSNGLALATAIAIVPTIKKNRPFKIWTFLSRFQMVFGKMAAICLKFKRLGIRISDPIQNLDHSQLNLFWTIQNPHRIWYSRFHCTVGQSLGNFAFVPQGVKSCILNLVFLYSLLWQITCIKHNLNLTTVYLTTLLTSTGSVQMRDSEWQTDWS